MAEVFSTILLVPFDNDCLAICGLVIVISLVAHFSCRDIALTISFVGNKPIDFYL